MGACIYVHQDVYKIFSFSKIMSSFLIYMMPENFRKKKMMPEKIQLKLLEDITFS
jgi:hypothetical protein